jgi:hypothetical protein
MIVMIVKTPHNYKCADFAFERCTSKHIFFSLPNMARWCKLHEREHLQPLFCDALLAHPRTTSNQSSPPWCSRPEEWIAEIHLLFSPSVWAGMWYCKSIYVIYKYSKDRILTSHAKIQVPWDRWTYDRSDHDNTGAPLDCWCIRFVMQLYVSIICLLTWEEPANYGILPSYSLHWHHWTSGPSINPNAAAQKITRWTRK